jgi:predicted metalloprotease with PDZ domain
VAQTSFDTWLNEDQQQKHNTSVDIYLEGSLVAWKLDQEIRLQTDDKYGIDELQKRLYNKHHNLNNGYNKSDILRLLKNITDVDFNVFWQNYVEGTKDIDFNDLLNFYGLQMTAKDNESDSGYGWIGAGLDLDNQLVTIKTVDTDSPIWLAGLTAGDVLLAINGIQVFKDNIEERIKQLVPKQAYKLHYFSAGRLLETTLTPILEPNPAFSIEPVTKPNRQQKARFKAWTGQDLVK